MDPMRTVKILDVVQESSRHVTLSFRDDTIAHYEPGQFVMVWVPGVDEVLTCGPERMMKAVVELARDRHIPVQASVERWMKCGVGICDACLVDGLRMCKEGPVLDGPVLFTLQDFGQYERDPSGTRKPLH